MADTIFTTNGSSCSGCPAATYQLDFDNIIGNNFIVTLTITFSSTATVGKNDNVITAVAFDMGTLAGINELTTAPGISNWTTSNNGISSSSDSASCTNNGKNFVCSEADFDMSGNLLDLADVTPGGTLTWAWNVNGTLTPSDFHIGAKYNSDCCTSTGIGCTEGLIISDSTGNTTPPTPTSEPASLAILGVGLLVVAGLVRRRWEHN